MSDIAADMRRACELRGGTYSTAEIWGLLGRGAAEIERLKHFEAAEAAATIENKRLRVNHDAWQKTAVRLEAQRDELLALVKMIGRFTRPKRRRAAPKSPMRRGK